MARLDWTKYKNFTKEEFDCKHTGKNRMDEDFMDILQQIRRDYGKPMIVTSGYRDITHPAEAKKKRPGEHSFGVAADIRVNGQDAMDLIVVAYGHGIRRFGIYQSGPMDGRFIHIGWGDKLLNFPEAIWTP